MKLNEQIERLRADGSRPEAKGRVIETLQRRNGHNTMKLIGKLGIPAALVAAVTVGGFLTVPQTALASPATVARAIRDIKNYVINSFTMVDGKRTLTSKTTVVDGKTSRQYFDNNGNPIAEGKETALDGALVELVVGKELPGKMADKVFRTRIGDDREGTVEVKGLPLGTAEKGSVEVKMTKGKDGKVTKRTFVNGKEVKELPAGMKDAIKVGAQSGTHVEGAHIQIGGEGHAPITRGGMYVVQGGQNGDVSHFASGQTSVDYLLKLLDDPSRWTITRGVVLNGQKLDKFTLNGGFSPIELYVDPATSLPRVLRFVGPADSLAPQIEDEYVYGAAPPVK